MKTTEEKHVDLLYALAQCMQSARALPVALETALNCMATSLDLTRATIMLISPETAEIRIQSSVGLKKDEQKRGVYVKGEGITGLVIESGQPICVANVSKEPRFLNKTQSRDLSHESLAFLCVPIYVNRQVVGALSVDHAVCADEELARLLRLLEIIASILGHAAMESQSQMDGKPCPHPPGFIGASGKMRNVYRLIDQVASSHATVLILGESGTGKELVAQAIHAASSRANAPFITLNCAALPETLIESELFGHERGAFTGANTRRKGRFELADHGTLFLDEIGELSLVTQAKLLRVLQNHAFERIGGTETQHSDVRILCATNRDLSRMIAEGTFRQDLFYRINVFPIELPPLRERPSDILPLCRFFLERFAKENDRPPIRMSYEVMDLLVKYAWPGNVRELENTVVRAVLVAGSDSLLMPKHLPREMWAEAQQSEETREPDLSLPQKVAALERAAITQALTESCGKLRQAAKILGLTERVLALKMKKYALSYKTFRKSP